MASSPAAAAPRVIDRLRATAAGGDPALDPDPLVFAWRSAPRQHVLAAAVALGIGLPILWIGLLVVRDLIAVLFGPTGDTAPLLRLVVDLPARLGGSRHVVFPGWIVARANFGLVALPLLVMLGALGAACGAVAARCAFAAEGRAVVRMREVAADTILATGTSGREDARGLAPLVGAALRAGEGWLAGAILLPALAIGTSLLALGLAAAVRPPLALVSVAGIGAVGILRRALLARRDRGARLWRSEGTALEGALTDLVRRLPAVRAHGTAPHERSRLSAEAQVRRRALGDSLAAVGRVRALAIGLAGLLMALMLGTLLFSSQTAPVEPGPFAAALAAFAIAARAVSALARSRTTYREAAPLLAAASDAIETIRRRHRPAARRPRRDGEAGAIPAEGDLALVAASAYDPLSGERLTAADLVCPMPSHVAIVGGRGSGARALAALVAGQLAPTSGQATFAGHDLARLDGARRAERIGFASGDAVLVAGTLLENLLYGCGEPPTGSDLEARLAEAMTVTGLDRLVYARGLSGVVDAEREASAVPALLEARAAVRAALVAQGADHLVEPFDPLRYNRQADLGENILFGEPVGDHFAADDLARHPFLQAVLEAEGLTRPLTELGLSVARSTTEIFADLPDDHPLFDAFSLFPAAERGFFEDLVARQPDARTLRRGPAGARDRDRLIGLALGYNETRHRFGLVDATFEAQIVSARRTFSRLLPQTLAAAIEFYDPVRLTSATRLQDNLLFGRIAQDEAGADARVSAILRGVLAERGLERLVYRIGLTGAVDPRATGNALAASSAVYGLAERATIELARCLIRGPDILVVAPQPEDGPSLDLDRLLAACTGRGLVLCLDEHAEGGLGRFDTVVKVERGIATATL